jgi:hypothetical protein
MLAGNTLYATDMGTGFYALDPLTLETKGGGNNMNERVASDLWITGSWGYTGTWGSRNGVRGNTIKVWSIAANGVPTIADSIVTPAIGTVSDVAVTPDGKMLVATAEGGSAPGLYVYDRTGGKEKRPVQVGHVFVPQGLHTGEVAVIGGRTYVFAARNPENPALLIYDITDLVP